MQELAFIHCMQMNYLLFIFECLTALHVSVCARTTYVYAGAFETKEGSTWFFHSRLLSSDVLDSCVIIWILMFKYISSSVEN